MILSGIQRSINKMTFDSVIIIIILIPMQAVSHIPKPCLPRLDPNDPNMVIGIPDEPTPVMDITPKDSKKVKTLSIVKQSFSVTLSLSLSHYACPSVCHYLSLCLSVCLSLSLYRDMYLSNSFSLSFPL